MAAPTDARQRLGAASSTSLVAAGVMVMNVLTYAFTLLIAHRTTPTEFGGISALLGILIVANVGSLALQATTARRTATSDPDVDGHTHAFERTAWELALAITVLLVVLTPVVVGVLSVSPLAALLAWLSVPGLTLMGFYAGLLQGRHRWTGLAATYLSMGLGRMLCGLVAAVVSPTIEGFMAAVAVGSLAPVTVGWFASRHETRTGTGRGQVLRELWQSGHNLLAFFTLTNMDLLLARHLLDPELSGVYAAGAVIAKACLFLPQFVIIVAFPGMSRDSSAGRGARHLRLAVSGILGLGVLVVLGALVLPGLAVTFVGGSKFSALEPIAWLFALEGILFAVLQTLVYQRIARQQRAPVLVWAAVLVVLGVALGLGLDSATVLVTTVVSATAVLTLVLIGLELRAEARREDPA